MSAIKDIPTSLRPREKAMRYGLKTLTDIELLALVIGSGTKDCSALDVAQSLLKDGGILKVGELEVEDLVKYKGISKVRALTLGAIFEISRRYFKELTKKDEDESVDIGALISKYQRYYTGETLEHLVVITLNKKGGIIKETELVSGSKDELSVSTKDVLKEVIKREGYSFIIIHNHPSGDTLPSKLDITFTYLLLNDSVRLGLTLLDHIIVGPSSYYSFKDSESDNLIKNPCLDL
ncbi:MAG: DNA repair protein RadC [Coprobacillus sp.]|nr:DNA repair protein RadC [Coprobacillus sp.]